MYGHIHIILKDMVVSQFGQAKWREILGEAGIDSHDAERDILDTVCHPDEVTYRLFSATCKATGLSDDRALASFGRHFVVFALRSGSARFLKAQGATLHAFLQNVNNLHHHLERDHPNATFPYIEAKYDPKTDDVYLAYLSTRKGLRSLVVGLVEEIGQRIYGLDVTFEETSVPPEYEDDFNAGRAAFWQVTWRPLRGGPVELPSLDASPPHAMSFASLHAAMMDFGKLVLMPQLCSLCSCNPNEVGAMLAPDVRRKLEELERGRIPPEDLLLRGTMAKQVSAAWSDTRLAHCRDFWKCSEGRGSDYQLSKDVLEVDVFVSHSWSPPENWSLVMGSDVEYAEVKTTTLAVMAKDIAQGRGCLQDWGEVTFWIDKACIPQDNAELKQICIGLLDKFIQRCDYMCVLFTWTYLNRLWCVYEWACVLVHKEPSRVLMQTELFVKDDTLPLYLETVRFFSLARTKCCEESDRIILQEKIHSEYISEEAFEKLVQATAIALMARSMAFRAGRSADLHGKYFLPWVHMAAELGFGALARALGRSRSIDWRKQAAPPSTGPSPTLLGRLGSVMGVDHAKYQRSVEEWFDQDVAPVLREIRMEAIRDKGN